MSSRKGVGRVSYSVAGGENSNGSGSDHNSSTLDQMSHGVANVMINPAEEGEWEVYSRKSRNKGGGNAGKYLGSSSASSTSWVQPEKSRGLGNGGGYKQSGGNRVSVADPKKQGGRGNSTSFARNSEVAYMPPAAAPPSIPPPLPHGWQWSTRGGSSTQTKPSANEKYKGATSPQHFDQQVEDASDENDELNENSDYEFSDDSDSDASQRSFETRKKSRWFKPFFEALDKLTVEQISETSRQWHCPACSKGPGAIDWYKGLQPLMTHAKTKGSSRMKLHRDFAELLEEELQRRGTSVIPTGEVFGRWKGLRETTEREIVWPPIVIVMNTQLDKDENEMWIGMGNQELLEYFQDYAAQKARHAYGPQGHRGMSVLIFEASAVGYTEAERLHKHFAEQGTDREAWDRKNKMLFYPGGRRQLYGFLACKEDLDYFNRHCQGKSKLKFEVKSYQEKVVSEMRQMNEENQKLIYLQNRVNRQQQQKKTLEETLGDVSQKLRETIEENRLVRERTTEQFKEQKSEMDYQQKFFNEQIAKLKSAAKEKEKQLENLLRKAEAEAGTKEECRLRQEEVGNFIDSQVKGVREFEELMQIHEGKKAAMKKKHLEEEVELQKEFDSKFNELVEKFAPSRS